MHPDLLHPCLYRNHSIVFDLTLDVGHDVSSLPIELRKLPAHENVNFEEECISKVREAKAFCCTKYVWKLMTT